MKTTLDLPDELMKAVKLRAVHENRKLKDMMADLLRRGLQDGGDQGPLARKRVRLPLVRCAHPAERSEGMTPERLANLLAEEDARGVSL